MTHKEFIELELENTNVAIKNNEVQQMLNEREHHVKRRLLTQKRDALEKQLRLGDEA